MQSGDLIAPNPQMESHLMRLATFCSLPESASLSPSMASKAGLYYTGEGDTVACYSCGLHLNHLEFGVQPMTVHRQLSPECQFVVTQHSDNVSAQQIVSQSRETSRERQRRRRRDYYRQLPSVAGSLRSPADTSTDRTSNDSSIVSSTLPHSNVDRFTSRQMMQRINSNDPSLLEEMKYERQRVSSYTNWPRDTNIEPEALAQAGLFYLCRADRVKCAFCHGILRNWEPSEEPMRKHCRLFPSCPFLRDPRAAGNVTLDVEPGEQQTLNVASNTTSTASTHLRHPDTETAPLATDTQQRRNPVSQRHRYSHNSRPNNYSMLASVAGGGNGMVDSPTHFAERVNNNDPTLLVEMKYERQRLATYSNWPRDVVNISPEALAQAGLFYLGLADRVKCPFCGGILCNWEPSYEPMREHHRNFPNCTFVRDARAAGNVAIGEEPTLTQTLNVASNTTSTASTHLRHPDTETAPLATDTQQRRNPVSQRHRYSHNSRPNNYSMLASVAGGGNGMVDSPTHFAERVNNNDPTLLVEMKYERQRLATYSNWPRDVVNISPEALAQAGLFYLGLADRVKCPFCGGILCNWEPSDEPMREHLRNFPNCTFVRDARAAGNVAIGEEPTLTQTLNINNNSVADGEMVLDIPLGNNSVEELIENNSLPLHDMTEESHRLNSFSSWPRNSNIQSELLAHSGLFYMGFVLCAFCHVVLRNTDSLDQELVEQQCHHPMCPFLRDPRAAGNVALGEEQPEENALPSTDGTTPAAASLEQSDTAATSQNTMVTCKVCLDAEMNYVFLPCGHLACCSNCGSALSICPICRSEKTGYVDVFLA